MDMMHGRATIVVDGTTLISEDGATLKPGGLINDVKMVGNRALPSQKMIASECKCKMAVLASTNIMDFQKMAGVEVQFQSDTGKIFTIRSAAQTAELELSEDGFVEPVFMGNPAIEQ